MANRRFNRQAAPSRDGKATTDMGSAPAGTDVRYGTTNWPGAGGSSQKPRNIGVPKLKNAFVKSEGI